MQLSLFHDQQKYNILNLGATILTRFLFNYMAGLLKNKTILSVGTALTKPSWLNLLTAAV